MTTPTQASPSRGRKRPADFTGRQTELLNEAKKVERAETSERVAMVHAQEAEHKNAIIDFETGQPDQQVEVRSVEVTSPTRTIRVNTDIIDMTWGRQVLDPGDYTDPDPLKHRPAIMGPLNNHTFKEGQAYSKVPVELAEHLNELGYLSYLGA